MTAADLLLAATAFAAAFISGLAGFAFNLVATGVFLHLLPPLVAVPVLLAASIVVQTLATISLRHALSWRDLAPYVIAGVIGTPIGTWLLLRIDPALFRLSVGVFLLAYSAWMLALRTPPKISGSWPADAAVGFAGGVLGGLAGLSGVLPTVWTILRGYAKDQARAIYQPFIIVIQVAGLATLWATGGIGDGAGGAFLAALPPILVGVWAGQHLYAYVNDRQFRLIVLWLLLVSGAVLVALEAARAFAS